MTISSAPTARLSMLTGEFVALFHVRACQVFVLEGVSAVRESPMFAVMVAATSSNAARRSGALK